MKKIYISLVAVLAMVMMLPHSYAKNDVKLYMFTKNGCPACEYAFEFFEKKLEEDPDAFELINIEVWCGADYSQSETNPPWITGSDTALALMEKVVDRFGEEIEGTPTIVVGDQFQATANNLDKLYEKIISYQTDKNYKDVVASIAKDNDIDVSKLNVPHGSASCDVYPKEEEKEETSKNDLVIIAGIFVVLIGGFAGLIFISKK